MNSSHKDKLCAFVLSKRRLFAALAGSLMALAAAAPLSGCVAYVRPHAEWAEPVDLRLDHASLAGVNIQIECSLDDGSGKLTPDDGDDCKRLRIAVGETGAKILLEDLPAEAVPLDPKKPVSEREKATRQRAREKLPLYVGDLKTEKPALKIAWVARPTEADLCGKTLIFLLFFGMGPCLQDIDSRATMIVTDLNKGTEIRKDLDLRVRRVLGAAALPLLLIDMTKPISRREYRNYIGENLLEYVQNTVYTFAVKGRLEAERPARRPKA